MHYRLLYGSLLACLIFCCTNCNRKKDITYNQDMGSVMKTERIEVLIKNLLAKGQENSGYVTDSLQLSFSHAMAHFYSKSNYKPVWSNDKYWNTIARSLHSYLDTAVRDGLFKNDYQYKKIDDLFIKLSGDSLSKQDNRYWAEADLLYSNAFMQIMQDLKQGRLLKDSLTWKYDPSRYSSFFTVKLNRLIRDQQFNEVLRSVQPKHPGYISLKKVIKSFVDSIDTKAYTYLNPYKKGSIPDSVLFIKKLRKRLHESNMAAVADLLPDSNALARAITGYQVSKNIKPDGKISLALIRSLNNTGLEKFKRLAVTLDRFKNLPEMPDKYIWVNLPAYKLEVWEKDEVVLESKVICGKSGTPTPLLTSAISDIVIYPTWTVPQSIIVKEILPGLKKNTGYLAKKGLSLFNNEGEMIDPASVNWSNYSKGIPYKVQQGSGDGNALGIIKFNFSNPYAVYLHDTNQRGLFKQSNKALSHGCVRVQEWEKLAYYILKNDSLRLNRPDTNRTDIQTFKTWITNKERHTISVRFPIPLFIRYFGCEAVNGRLKFYDDIYGADKLLSERYFTNKRI